MKNKIKELQIINQSQLEKKPSLFTLRTSLKCAAFTLAETLITLGIIGVVAALVMPSVINEFKRRELESRFNKLNTVVEQAMKMTLMELGLEKYSDMAAWLTLNEESRNTAYKQFNQVWTSQFRGAKYIKNWGEVKGNAGCYTFWGTNKTAHSAVYCGYSSGYLLPDNMFISELNPTDISNPASRHNTIYFDTNGPYKGPNRKGYDIFQYGGAGMGYGTTSSSCNPLITNNTANLNGCYGFAKKNMNPLDNSKSYWEGLYKPKSWWEKL